MGRAKEQRGGEIADGSTDEEPASHWEEQSQISLGTVLQNGRGAGEDEETCAKVLRAQQ